MSSSAHDPASEGALPDDTAESTTDGLGPFDPPDDYAFELELVGEPPRPIADDLRRGRHAHRQSNVIHGWLVVGAALIMCAPLPFVQQWGLYVLPLQYLGWIGLGCVALGGLVWVKTRFGRGPYQYVEEGIPLVARIRALVMAPSAIVNGQAVRYCFRALIDYRHPGTGEEVTTEAVSNDFTEMRRDELTTTYRQGDYVTAVYLPSKPEEVVLYGFLDLKPGLGLIRRDASERNSLLMTVLGVAVLVGFFGVLGWNVFAFGRYAPLETAWVEYLVPFALGVVVLGGGFLAILAGLTRHEARKANQRNESAIQSGQAVELSVAKGGIFGQGLLGTLILLAGAVLLGGMSGLCQGFTVNAWLDDSPPQRRPVRITSMVMTTHNFLFREYTIEYEFLDKKAGQWEELSFLSTPAHMNRFGTDLALAEVHAGRFGWPWVKTLHPVELIPAPGAAIEPK